MARKIIEFVDCWQIFRSDVSYKGLQQEAHLYELILAHSHSSQPNLGLHSNFKSLNVSRSHSKHFEVSVSLSKKSTCLGLAKKTPSLAVSRLPFATTSFPGSLILPHQRASEERPWHTLVTCHFDKWKHQGGVLRNQAIRELKKTTTATAAATSLNKGINEQNNGSACAL